MVRKDREDMYMKTVKVRKLTLGQGRPKICIPLVAGSMADLGAQAELIKEFPADMAEWRLDWFEGLEDGREIDRALALVRQSLGDLPLLVTFRTEAEGGRKPIGKEEYFALLKKLAAREDVDLLDMEAWFDPDQTVARVEELQAMGKVVILSHHNFSRTPSLEEMTDRLETMARMGADIAKLAVMPQTMEDVYRLLTATSLVHEKDLCPLITMSMGRQGIVSRLCGEISGSCLTFGIAGQASAPGQAAADRLCLVLDQIHDLL